MFASALKYWVSIFLHTVLGQPERICMISQGFIDQWELCDTYRWIVSKNILTLHLPGSSRHRIGGEVNLPHRDPGSDETPRKLLNPGSLAKRFGPTLVSP